VIINAWGYFVIYARSKRDSTATLEVNAMPWYVVSALFLVAIFWIIVQAHAGYRYGLFIFENAYSTKEMRVFRPDKKIRCWAYGVPHCGLYVICTLSGFIALYYAWQLVCKICWSTINGGTASVLIALVVLTISGISGALPRILYLGGKPI
jgi:hypothetical protein